MYHRSSPFRLLVLLLLLLSPSLVSGVAGAEPLAPEPLTLVVSIESSTGARAGVRLLGSGTTTVQIAVEGARIVRAFLPGAEDAPCQLESTQQATCADLAAPNAVDLWLVAPCAPIVVRATAGDLTSSAQLTYPAACPPPPAPTFTWTIPDPWHGAGVITWQGPGSLTKQRGMDEWHLDSANTTEVRTMTMPGAPPIDIAWRPLPGDRFCVRAAGTWQLLGCTTVPLPMVDRAILPLVMQ